MSGKQPITVGNSKVGIAATPKVVDKKMGSTNSNCDKDLFYFTVDKITEQDLKVAKQKKVEVNGETLALIYNEKNKKIYAIQDKCPHYGGPLHQGDIEDVPPEGICIRCPWHSWKFSLTTGKCISPQRDDKAVKIYPVKVIKETKEIKIGFESIAESIFSTPP